MAVQSARPAPGPIAAPDRSASLGMRTRRILGRDWPIAYIFILPLVLLLFGLIGYPLLTALRLSFYNVVGVQERNFVGLGNYQRLWGDAAFRESVLHTIQFATISVFFKFWVGLGAALLLHRLKRFKALFTGLVLLPWIIPEVVAALIWRGLYNTTYGGLNQTALALGLLSPGQSIDWLGNFKLALPAMIVVNVWKGIPFFTIIILAGLKSIDATLYDAAAVDGANAWHRFLNITLPGVRYVTIVACLLSMIFTLNAFGLIYLITGGGPGGATRIFSILAYELAFGQLRAGLGVAVTMALVPVLLLLIVVLGRYMRGDTSQSTREKDGSALPFGQPWYVGLPIAIVAAMAGVLAARTLTSITLSSLPKLLVIVLALIITLRYVMYVLDWTFRQLGRWSYWQYVWPFALAAVGLLLRVLVNLHISLVAILVVPAAIIVLRYVIDAIEQGLSAVSSTIRKAATSGREEREGSWRGITKVAGNVGAAAALGTLVLFELYPFFFMIITAFKTDAQVRTGRSIFWPVPFTIEHFNHMLTQTGFPRWFLNSLQVAVVSCVLSVIIGALGAYALTRLKWRGAGFMSTAILFVYLMPSIMVVIPLYRILTQLGQINTLRALMITYPSFGLPFACWLLMGYYRSIPEELEEAALIDGCNHFQAFFRIILPLTLPALMTVGLFAITGAFNEFVIANIMVNSDAARTLPVGLAGIVIGDIFPFGLLYSASIMTAIPVTILYMLAQRFMVDGLTAGSVKG